VAGGLHILINGKKHSPRLRSWPNGHGRDLFFFSASRFDFFYARMSPSRYLTCLLILQGVQWIRGLVVMHVSWPGQPGLSKKKKSTPPESKGQEMGFWEHFITCLPSNLASITHMISFFLFSFSFLPWFEFSKVLAQGSSKGKVQFQMRRAVPWSKYVEFVNLRQVRLLKGLFCKSNQK